MEQIWSALRSSLRREALNDLFAHVTDLLRLSPLLQASAGNVLEAVQKLSLEGVVGKRRGSLYEPGKRSGLWIKRRTNREQEFVIGGYVPGARGFETLIVGVYEKKLLTYVAKVKRRFCPESSRRHLSGAAKTACGRVSVYQSSRNQSVALG